MRSQCWMMEWFVESLTWDRDIVSSLFDSHSIPTRSAGLSNGDTREGTADR